MSDVSEGQSLCEDDSKNLCYKCNTTQTPNCNYLQSFQLKKIRKPLDIFRPLIEIFTKNRELFSEKLGKNENLTTKIGNSNV